MAFDREAAKQAGYTDAEIDAFLQAKQREAQPSTDSAGAEPPAPTTVVAPIEPGATAALTTGALGAAPYAVPVAGAAAAGIGGSKLYGAWKQSAEAAKALADAKLASEQGIAQRAAQRAAAATPAPQPTAGYSNVRYNVPTQMTAPTAGPVAPAAAPTAMPAAAPTPAAQPNVIQRGTEYIRQLAMNRVLPAAGQMVRGGGVTSAALYTPELGPKVPTVGRMRGMEINPLTRRPWTPDQLAAYERNPQQFDAQLGAPQMPR